MLWSCLGLGVDYTSGYCIGIRPPTFNPHTVYQQSKISKGVNLELLCYFFFECGAILKYVHF